MKLYKFSYRLSLTAAAQTTVVATAMAITAPAIAQVTHQSPPVLSPYNLTPDQIAVLDTDVPVLDIWEGADNRNIVEVFGAIDIDASPAIVWDIMTDCDKQLLIVDNMTKCKVKETNKAAGWDERVQVLSIGRFLPRVTSKFKSEHTPYREIKITRTGGDLSVLDGLWSLALTHDGQTRVTYRARLKSKFPVPRSLMQKGTRKDMPKVLMKMRDLAESFNQAPIAIPAAIPAPAADNKQATP